MTTLAGRFRAQAEQCGLHGIDCNINAFGAVFVIRSGNREPVEVVEVAAVGALALHTGDAQFDGLTRLSQDGQGMTNKRDDFGAR